MRENLEKLEKITTNIWYDKERKVYRLHLGYNRKYFGKVAELIETNTLEEAQEKLKEIRTIIANNKMEIIKQISLDKDFNELKSLKKHPFPYNALEVVFNTDEIDNISLEIIDKVEWLVSHSDNIKELESSCFLKHFRDGIVLDEIAKPLNVSRERIRQRCWIVCKKLKYIILNYDRLLEIKHREEEKRLALEQLENHRKELIKIFRETGQYNEEMEITFGSVEIFPNEKYYQNDLLNTPIAEMDLSVRLFNCLRRAGIENIGDLTKHTEIEMYKVRNLGKKSLREIKEKLLSYGLEFKGNE